MAQTSDPGPDDRVTGEFFTDKCRSCGWLLRGSICQAIDCGRRFIQQPGYRGLLCPQHDPALADAPAEFREEKLAKSQKCAECGEQVLGA